MIKIIILMLFGLPAMATNYHFANAGNDATGNGSVSLPYATFGKLNAITLVANDTCSFNRGDTFNGTITNNASGGSMAARIVYTYYGTGPDPIFNGFTSLTSWSNLGSNIWEASCNSGYTLNLVTINGIVAKQGRTPNIGSYYSVVASGGVSYPTITGYLKARLSQVNASTKNWTNAEIVVRSTQYDMDRNLVTSATDSTINYNSQSAHNADIGSGFFFQNDVSTLDQQNEWYYNPTSHTLRMYSTSNPSGLNVKAATSTNACGLDGISYLNFNGIKFSGYDSTCLIFANGTGVKVQNCTFDLIGCNGIFAYSQTRDSMVNNTFTNIQNIGIFMNVCTYPAVLSNYINGCGLNEGTGQGNNQQMDGISLVQTIDSPVVKFNIVMNVGYCGIDFDGRNAVVKKNYVYKYGLTLADGGGIYSCCNNYSNDASIGWRLIDSNHVSNGVGTTLSSPDNYGVPGIYMDDDAGNIIVSNNTIDSTTRSGIFLHNTDSIRVLNNNIFAATGGNAFLTVDDGAGGPVRHTVVTGNNMYSNSTTSLVQIISVVNDYGMMGIVNNNHYIRSSTTNPFNTSSSNYSLSSWKTTFGWDANSTFTTVPDDSVRLFSSSVLAPVSYNIAGKTYNNLIATSFYNNIVYLNPFEGKILFSLKYTPSTFAEPKRSGIRYRKIKIN